jgi:hypothetical protein
MKVIAKTTDKYLVEMTQDEILQFYPTKEAEEIRGRNANGGGQLLIGKEINVAYLRTKIANLQAIVGYDGYDSLQRTLHKMQDQLNAIREPLVTISESVKSID